MIQRRTRARLEFLGSVLAVLLLVRLWPTEESTPVSPSIACVGALGQGLRLWVRDRDVAGIRTNRRRRLLSELGWGCLQFAVRRVTAEENTARFNFHAGALAATVAYRFRYGLVGPLPDG